NIEAQLLVWLKGTDLFANTAYLTLVGKMDFAGKLAGIKRFDYFRFHIDSQATDPDATVTALKGVLDRQSTFYNRNKHAYSLDCGWEGDSHLEGLPRAEVQSRWVGELSNIVKNQQVVDFYGKDSSKQVIFNELKGYLVEVVVEEEDPSARDSVAAKLQSGLGGTPVSCLNRATLWWLALCVQTQNEAAALAREITITTRRDSGLLMNPNYQSAEFVSVSAMPRVSND
ncbi:MAG: hypothetical protein KAJ37_04070, partial [Candidatus Krumholzibacteria bacterium]|nr:hypothetical protein [Candidatus Krumholzibacteria bacterium]